MGKNWMAALQKLDGAIDRNDGYDPFAHVIRSHSPSVNFTFGRAQGLPAGFSLLLYGPPKGGKSLLTKDFVGQMHADYADGIAICFDTEFRERGQLTLEEMKIWGIDPDRYVTYQVNSPDLIYDRIETQIAAMCKEGAPIKLIVIDSINDILGRRAMNADSVMTQQIGDNALTNQEGLKRILAVQRKYGFALIIVAQQRAEMDATEQARGNKIKPGVAYSVGHFAEYYMYVEPNRTKAGASDLQGNGFTDTSVSRTASVADLAADGEKMGHRIRVTMKDSSMGPKGRQGEFTYFYDKGIVNTHEEVFLLGIGRGIIEQPTTVTYVFGDRKWTGGKTAILTALSEDPDLCSAILKELKRRDLAGMYAAAEVPAEPVADV